MNAIKSSTVLPGECKEREIILARRGGSEELGKISRRRLHLSYLLKERGGFTQRGGKGFSENSDFRNTFV